MTQILCKNIALDKRVAKEGYTHFLARNQLVYKSVETRYIKRVEILNGHDILLDAWQKSIAAYRITIHG